MVWTEMGHIHVSSLTFVTLLCSSEGREESFGMGKLVLARHSRGARRRHQFHVVNIMNWYNRHKLIPVKPTRAETGNFGHYIKIGAGAKLFSEVFAYLVLLLKLRELGLSRLV